jgi:hypothetical protein
MALKPLGDLSFKLQVGAVGPKPDPVYHLSRRYETWQGKADDLTAFLNLRPLGSAHPSNAVLKLAEFEPRHLEAGMVDVALVYAGANASPGVVTRARQSLLKTGVLAGKMVRRFQRMVSATITGSAVTSEVWGWIEQEIEAEKEYAYYTPSVTFRYCSSTDLKAAQMSAASDLSGASPAVTSSSVRIVGQEWVTRAGVDTSGNLSGITVRNLTTFFEASNGQSLGTPTVRATDFSCEQVGLSGWYEVQETHEYELV